GVLQKAGDIEGLFSKAHVRVTLKDTVLKMEPVDKVGIIDQETVYFKTFFDSQFLIFVLSYLQSRNVHGIALAKIVDEYIDTKSSENQLKEIMDDLDTSDFVKPAKDYNNALDMIAESPLYNPERTITEDKHYQENMKAISKIYKGICEKCEPEIYSELDALTAVYEEDMLSIIYKIAFKQGYLVAAEIYKNLYNNQNTDFEVFEFDEDDDEWF
ncbi:hypothetical protein IJ556_05105, partial [bacterium]|nr:hypothetical protein [bacterium]